MRRFIRYLFIILSCNLLFLFAPKNECNDLSAECPFTVIRINSIMGFHMSWDGYKFISYAQHPKEILKAGNERQSRPLFIAMGSAAGYSLWYISRPFHHFITSHLKPTTSGQ